MKPKGTGMRILNWLLDVPSTDPDDARRRRLVSILLIGMTLSIPVALLTIAATGALGLGPPWQNTRLFYLGFPALLVAVVVIYIVNRYWSGRLAVWLAVLVLIAFIFTDNAEQVTSGRSLAAFAIPIFVASFLLHPYAGFIVAGLVSLATAALGVGVLQTGLNVPAMLVFFVIATGAWVTARTLERALAELRTVNLELDQRIAERAHDLQRRSIQLQTASEVARDATAILDIDQLLDETVHVISERFGYYHAGVFLVDEQGEYAVLHAASSEGGRRMLEKGHKLAVGKVGIVGHVANAGEPRIALDVGKDATHFVNPDLPATRSEMALPLVSRGRVIGVFDVQSIQEAAFTEEDVAALRTMADQLANAIENARLYTAELRRRQEAETLYRATQALATTLDLPQVLESILSELQQVVPYDSASVQLLRDGQRLEIIGGRGFPNLDELLGLTIDPLHGDNPNKEVMHRRAPFIVDDAPAVYSEFRKDPHAAAGIRSWMGVPLLLGDRLIGMLSLDKQVPGFYTAEHVRYASAFATQAAVAIENARLYEGIKRHIEELTALHNIDVAITSTLNLDEVLEAVYRQIREIMNPPTFYIALYNEDRNEVHLRLIVDQGERLTPFTLRAGEGSGLAGWVVRTRQPLWIRDRDEDTLPAHAVTVGAPARSMMIWPLIVRDKVVGVMSAQSHAPYAFDDGHWRLFSGIAGQVAIAVENARLYQKLETQTIELARAYNELQEIDRLRTQLVQNVSHEFRTPLSLIKGYVELLLAGDLGSVAENQQTALRVIQERTSTLARLIHNMTTLQSVPREALTLAPTSLVEIARNVLAEFCRPAEEAGIVFHEELPAQVPLVLGDRERLELVLGQLVDNAIKFSPGGGTVIVRVWSEQDRVCVSVADEGIGIPPEHLSQVFKRFYQVNGSTTRRFGGMGIGLALVYEIVETHGGDVAVESEPEKGSTFTISLPRIRVP
jgi:signal transduction histidine kinase